MIDLLLDFAQTCRSGGLRVSTAEVLDCAAQLEYTDLSDEAVFRTTLRANFAKSRRDQKLFERLYHLFFLEMKPPVPCGPDQSPEEEEYAGFVEDLRPETAQDRLDRAILDFLSDKPSAYLELLREIDKREETPAAAGAQLEQAFCRFGRTSFFLPVPPGDGFKAPAQAAAKSEDSRPVRRFRIRVLPVQAGAHAHFKQENHGYNTGGRQIQLS